MTTERLLRIEACPTTTGSAVLVAIEPRCADESTGDGSTTDLAQLPAHERHRAATMPAHRRGEFVRGRSLLRRLVAAEFDVAPPEVPVAVSPSGSLHLDGWPGSWLAGISLSHCPHWTVAAVYRGGEVGVDVEDPPDVLDDRLVQRCLAAEAPAVLAMPLPARAAAFVRVWAVQEACVKATGEGIAGAPWRIPVGPEDRCGRWRDVRWQALPLVEPAALAIATRPWSATAGPTEPRKP